jgi:hypothetical protein
MDSCLPFLDSFPVYLQFRFSNSAWIFGSARRRLPSRQCGDGAGHFYRMFEIRDAVRLVSTVETIRHMACGELSWSRYRLLMQVEDPVAREWTRANLWTRTTAQVTGQVAEQVLRFCRIPRKASEIRELLHLKHRETFTDNYLRPLLEKGWLEPTIPGKPRSRMQRYRTTEAGLAVLEKGTTGAPKQGRDEAPSSNRGGPSHG